MSCSFGVHLLALQPNPFNSKVPEASLQCLDKLLQLPSLLPKAACSSWIELAHLSGGSARTSNMPSLNCLEMHQRLCNPRFVLYISQHCVTHRESCCVSIPCITCHCHPAFSSGIGRDETAQRHGPNLATLGRMATYNTLERVV